MSVRCQESGGSERSNTKRFDIIENRGVATETLAKAVSHAREAKRGVWAEDRTNAGFEVEGLRSITDEHVVLSKLFAYSDSVGFETP